MAGLADDWEENRQTCVDVLCAYLRMPYEPDPGQDVPGPRQLAFQAIREVRHTVIRVITAHLKKDAAGSWQGLNFDFTGVVFDGGDFNYAKFSGGAVSFLNAKFSFGLVLFGSTEFSGGTVYFTEAEFSGGVAFTGAVFSGGTVYFAAVTFSGAVPFTSAVFSGGTVSFRGAKFPSGGLVIFEDVKFSGGTVDFRFAKFSGGTVPFSGAEFSGGPVSFDGAKFSGATVEFGGAQFSGGTVDFSDVDDWSFPPAFPWTDTPPPGVTLPEQEARSE